jgi:hypothetical protein
LLLLASTVDPRLAEPLPLLADVSARLPELLARADDRGWPG